MDTMLAGDFNEDLLTIANQKAAELKEDRLSLQERINKLKRVEDGDDSAINLAESWKRADYKSKKAIAMIMIHKIVINEDGSTQILWNI